MSTQNDIAPDELSFKILEPSDDLSAFDCSKDDNMGLNEFIHKEAIQYQKEKLGVTHLFLYNGRIVGFATLAMGQIEIKEARFLLRIKVKITDYPTMLIGRLAIHNDFRDRNVGRSICLWCLELAKELSKKVGCKLVTVLTEDRPVEFYKKVGFEIFPRCEKKTKKWMYLLIP
jgi:predicted GNAT family N-acyltransferase